MDLLKTILGGVLLCVVVALIGFVFYFAAADVSPPPVRALWTTRFDYSNPEDVRRIVGNAHRAGFTDLFFQIRGNGTAFYRSRLEPWAFELSGTDAALTGRDPGWDPLQTAIDAAKPFGLRIHAYLNVLPGWRGRTPPPRDAGQLWTAHPEWFMVDALGKKMQPTAGWYAFLNPTMPEVRKHLCDVVRELTAYDVAGIHLDYLRYPYDYALVAREIYPDANEEELARHADFSYDPVSLSALSNACGAHPTHEETLRFKRESITRLLFELSNVVRRKRRTADNPLILSACVLGNPIDGRLHACQNVRLWVRKGLADWIVQMDYGIDSFGPYLLAMRRAAGWSGFRHRVVVGIRCDDKSTEAILRQIDRIERTKCRGFALFSYEALFGKDHRLTPKGRVIVDRIRLMKKD